MPYPSTISPEVPPCPEGGRRLAIADVHGCIGTFRALVEKRLGLTKRDQLFQLGDLVDRGPDSAAVLDYVMGLQSDGYQVFPLRGNHEQNLLDAYAENDPRQLLAHAQRNNCGNLLDGMGYLLPRFRDFLFDLPHYYGLEDFLLVHAGFNFRAPRPFEDTDSMLWIRGWSMGSEGERIAGGRRVVHGHNPVYLVETQEAIESGAPIIPLDNACVFYPRLSTLDDFRAPGGYERGNLLALDLDTLELTVQEYEEG